MIISLEVWRLKVKLQLDGGYGSARFREMLADAETLAGIANDQNKNGRDKNVNGMHDLAAALVARAEASGDKKDAELVEGVYRQQFCVTDMLPQLATYGLLVEINAVREVVLSAMSSAGGVAPIS